MIEIIAKKEGFRRCGIAHTGTKQYPDGTFTKKQLDELKAEPLLVVREIPGEVPAEKKGKSKAE